MPKNMTDTEIAKILLPREPMTDMQETTAAHYRGKTVLVTGGGGSIGSELCRRIAECSPQKLVIFDIYENCAYELLCELSSEYGDSLDVSVEIGSVQDRACLRALFEKYVFDTVFHAAAHKHVPLMENCPAEAIKNNVFGTYNVCDMAEEFGCERFILISTDKAVNPESVMGATKRLCEMIAGCRGDSRTVFSAVRFGNVFASAGSAVPLFCRQIENGGPVKLTDKRMTRYFMTVTEAAMLVMEAGAFAGAGELFVLDMGEQVNIYELVCKLIRLMGSEPEKDIKIEEIGVRPGEKISEELSFGENLKPSGKEKIYIEKEAPLKREEVEEKLRILLDAVRSEDNETVRKALSDAVPTYRYK